MPMCRIGYLKIRNFSSNVSVVLALLHNTYFSEIELLDLASLQLSFNLQRVNSSVLRYFVLDQNNFQKFPVEILDHHLDLEYLSLNENVINYLSSDDFKNLRKLYRINLSNNRIAFIDEGTFGPTTKLRILDLSNNNIKLLSYHPLFKPLKNFNSNQIMSRPGGGGAKYSRIMVNGGTTLRGSNG